METVFSPRFVLPPAQCSLVGSCDFCLFTHMDCNFVGLTLEVKLQLPFSLSSKQIIKSSLNLGWIFEQGV